MKSVFLLPLSIVLLFSCKEKISEPVKANDPVMELAAPHIAQEIGHMDNYLNTAKNKSLHKLTREDALIAIVKMEANNGLLYIIGNSVSIDSLDTETFNNMYKTQKDYVVLKWMESARQELYKKKLQDSLLATGK